MNFDDHDENEFSKKKKLDVNNCAFTINLKKFQQINSKINSSKRQFLKTEESERKMYGNSQW